MDRKTRTGRGPPPPFNTKKAAKAGFLSLLWFRFRGNRGSILDKTKFALTLDQPFARLAVALFCVTMLGVSRVDRAYEI
jgi:hypothetical protein